MKKALKAAGLIAAAVVLGLLTTQGSYALWNTTAPANAGTIQAADFKVLVNNVDMSKDTPIALNIGELAPGGSAYTSLTVTNKVNVTADSPLVLKPSLSGLVPVNNFGGNLTVTTAVAPAGTACKDLARTSYTSVPPTATALAVGASRTFCIKVALKTGTKGNNGKPINIPVTLTMAQPEPTK